MVQHVQDTPLLEQSAASSPHQHHQIAPDNDNKEKKKVKDANLAAKTLFTTTATLHQQVCRYCCSALRLAATDNNLPGADG